MPQMDNRRINGPRESQPLEVFRRRNHTVFRLLKDDGLRRDGRKSDEVRPIFLKAGIVTQAKGSSYLETAGTKVICGVYGPRESQRKQEFKSEGKLTCEINYAPFSRYERHRSVPSSQDKEYSNLVIQALEAAVCLETFPKAQVDIYINVLQDDGNVLASSIICASVALANAGIEMFDLVSACSLVYDDQNFVIDASCDEINTPHSHGTMIVGYLPSMNLISCLVQDGDMEADRSIAATKACIEGSIRIYAIMQESLVKSVKKRTEQRYI